jgi:flagellar biosynthetic protein FliS
MIKTALEKYNIAIANTSGQKNQLIFIFNEISKLLNQAKQAMGEKDYEAKFKFLAKITEVLSILRSGIDEKSSHEHKNIASFYDITIEKLEYINIRGQEPEELDPIIKAMSEIRLALVK